jgi:GNAT superfamily N-acetyltransferase
MFLLYRGAPMSFAALTEAASRSLQQTLYTTVDLRDVGASDVLQSAGFETEVVNERFRIRFDRAIQCVRRAWVPSGCSIRSAVDVDIRRLFTLDNTLRQDVPGTDGWRGNWDWFREEVTDDPAFDPSTYLVGIDDGTGEYAGLVRIWRNPDGPRLGLLAVLPQYRNTVIGAALLKQALTAAVNWGYEAFDTETSPANPVTYPRMARLGAQSRGRSAQLRRR